MGEIEKVADQLINGKYIKITESKADLFVIKLKEMEYQIGQIVECNINTPHACLRNKIGKIIGIAKCSDRYKQQYLVEFLEYLDLHNGHKTYHLRKGTLGKMGYCWYCARENFAAKVSLKCHILQIKEEHEKNKHKKKIRKN